MTGTRKEQPGVGPQPTTPQHEPIGSHRTHIDYVHTCIHTHTHHCTGNTSSGCQGVDMALVDIYFCLLCKGVLPACIYAQYSNVWCLRRTKEGTRSPGTGIIGCKLPHGCREPTVVPLQEHQLFLTTEPAL